MKAALKQTFSSSCRWVAFLALAFAIFALLFLVPVWTTPGNDIAFQAHLFTTPTYAVMILLSLLNALVILMQWHIRQVTKCRISGKQTAAGAGMLATAFLATIGCASCYSSVLAIFGLGGTAFIVEYRWWIAGLSILLALLAIHYAARRINNDCQSCGLPVR